VSWFLRHGGKAVFFGRMIPIFRSLISIPAGITRMPLWKFGLLTAAGSLVWNSIFVMAGFLLGESWHVVEQYVDILQYFVIGAVAIGVTWFVFARTRSLVAAARSRGSEEPDTLDAELEELESELDERADASRD
jgi:membrane protein DedA with SNARE-associated domain